MPRYFFDVHNGGSLRDDTGTELPDAMKARREAMQLLPDIARELIPEDGDRRHITVLVKDEKGAPVYSAALTFTGIWLT